MKIFFSLFLIGFVVVLFVLWMVFVVSVVEDKVIYCGFGFIQYLVLDDVVGCLFSEVCCLYDICYGCCDKDGDFYGSVYCV